MLLGSLQRPVDSYIEVKTMSDESPLRTERLMAALREIAEAVPAVAREMYRDDGLVYALTFILFAPVLVPIAAVVYYSIPREQRELLDESEEFRK